MASVDMPDPFEDVLTSPCPRDEGMAKTWDEIRLAVKKSHRQASSMLNRTPQTFTFRCVQNSAGVKQHRVYFLGSLGSQRDNSLMFVDVNFPEAMEDQEPPRLAVKPLLDSFRTSALGYGQLSKEEQLLRERKRMRSYGIASYDYHEGKGMFAFSAGNSFFVCTDTMGDSGLSVRKMSKSHANVKVLKFI